MDQPKRQLAVLAVIGVVVSAYYVYTEYVAKAEQQESAETTAADGETADGETTTGGSDSEEGEPGAEDTEGEAAEEASAPAIDAPPGVAGTPLFAPDPTSDARREAQQTLTIETDVFRAELSSLHTGLVSFRLLGERFTDEAGDPIELVTTNREPFAPFRVYVDGLDIPLDATWEGEQVDERTVRFTWRGDDHVVVRRVEAGRGDYQLWSTVRVVNQDRGERWSRVRFFTHDYVSAEEESSGFIGRPSPKMSFGVCRYGDGELEREGTEGLLDPRGYGPGVQFSGIHNTYFGNVLVAPDDSAARCVVTASRRGGSGEEFLGTLLQAELRYEGGQLAPGEERVVQTMAYLGPTDRDALAAAGHHLREVVDLGWFGFIAEGFNDLLGAIQSVVGNWGIAIILLTILVKLLFYPLTMRSFRAMARMRQLKPQIDAINEKFKDERELKGQAIMALYKREKVNPAAGCLPSLLQMPVWFALYRALSTNLELYHAQFLVWTDLSAPDPFFALPLFVAALMHLQQRFTPTTMDPAQAKIMMWGMPIMIGSFMLFLPAGLCLYMVTNSSLTILQQRFIYAKLDREEANAKNQPTPIDEDEGGDADASDDDSGDELSSDEENDSSSASSRRRSRSSRNRKKRQRRGRA